MRCELNYGRGSVSLSLPENLDVTIVRKRPMPILHDASNAVRAAFANPVNCPPLSELAQKAHSAVIAICDITRPVPNHLFLRPLVEVLVHGGISLKRIIILVATGLHRPNLGTELEELIGDPWVFQNVPIENHYARNDDDHVYLGRTNFCGISCPSRTRLSMNGRRKCS